MTEQELEDIKRSLKAIHEKYGEMLFIGGSFPKNGFDIFKDIRVILEIIDKLETSNLLE
jgi:hypothetical protein